MSWQFNPRHGNGIQPIPTWMDNKPTPAVVTIILSLFFFTIFLLRSLARRTATWHHQQAIAIIGRRWRNLSANGRSDQLLLGLGSRKAVELESALVLLVGQSFFSFFYGTTNQQLLLFVVLQTPSDEIVSKWGAIFRKRLVSTSTAFRRRPYGWLRLRLRLRLIQLSVVLLIVPAGQLQHGPGVMTHLGSAEAFSIGHKALRLGVPTLLQLLGSRLGDLRRRLGLPLRLGRDKVIIIGIEGVRWDMPMQESRCSELLVSRSVPVAPAGSGGGIGGRSRGIGIVC